MCFNQCPDFSGLRRAAMRLSVAATWLTTGFNFLKEGSMQQVVDLLGSAHSLLGSKEIATISNAFDISMGLVALLFASKKLWKFQFFVTALYTIGLIYLQPGSLLDPIQSLSKNFVLLCAMVYLALSEEN